MLTCMLSRVFNRSGRVLLAVMLLFCDDLFVNAPTAEATARSYGACY